MLKYRIIYEFELELHTKRFYTLVNQLINQGYFGEMNILVWQEEIKNGAKKNN